MNDYRSKACGDTGPNDGRDIVPIGHGRHAGAAEFEHNPGLTIFEHSSDRTCNFNSAPNRVLPRSGGAADQRRLA